MKPVPAHADERPNHVTWSEAFPWISVLPEADRQEFAEEFVRVFRACAEADNWSPLAETLHAWRTTAEIHSHPDLVRQLSEPLNDLGPESWRQEITG
ncbi:hypothetical protein GCM10022247_15940 [Allokutzneria multivorans]|uniref:Uncharacterized protein n=1 Tax=Allokutzneria multivorans TaxID=1142134 RepID=A0ABP7RFL7_9PSEU